MDRAGARPHGGGLSAADFVFQSPRRVPTNAPRGHGEGNGRGFARRGRMSEPLTTHTAGMESELIRQITELATLQSNTLALVEKLLVRAEPPEQLTAQQRQAALITLEVTTQEAEQKLEAAKRSAAELLISLNVPADIST